MNKKEEFFRKINNGILRGSQAKLARDLHITTATTSKYYSGAANPSEETLKKMSEIYEVSEEELKQVFQIEDGAKTGRREKYLQPLGAVVKDRLVVFFDIKNIPNRESIVMQKKIVLEVRSDSLSPDIEEGDKVGVILTDTTEGNEGEYFLIKKGLDFFIKELNKTPKDYEVLGVIKEIHKQYSRNKK